MSGLWDFLLTVTGTDDTTGKWYGFWSGFGSDLGEFAILGGLVGVYRTRICHARWCWRVGREELDGTQYVVCRKHDPRTGDDDDAPTAEQIAERYHRVSLRRHHQN